MPGTVKSELLSDADRSHKCDSQEKVCWIRHLSLDKSHFITGEVEFKISFLGAEAGPMFLLTEKPGGSIIVSSPSGRWEQEQKLRQ